LKTIYLIRHAESTGQQPDGAFRDLEKTGAGYGGAFA
jgi:phosphohistidine phosphatase SixA